MVVRLKGYVFFASAQKLATWVLKQIEINHSEVPEYRQLKWIVFDCETLDGLDSSASKCMAKVAKAAEACHVKLIWSGMSDSFRKSLIRCDTIRGEQDWFRHLDEAMCFAQKQMTNRIVDCQRIWTHMHPNFLLAHRMIYDRSKNCPFDHILPYDASRFGCPWLYCGRLQMVAYETILWEPGTDNADLFLVYNGKVGHFTSVPHRSDPKQRSEIKKEWEYPFAVYTNGWFLNRQALWRHPTTNYAVALTDGEALFWNEHQWARMSRERPRMAAAIMKAVLLQQSRDAHLEMTDKLSKSEISEGEAEIEFRTHNHHICFSKEFPEMQTLIHDQALAEAFEKLGVYEPVPPDEELPLPDLPRILWEDIDVAFDTYAVGGDGNAAKGVDPSVRIRKENLPDAMRYAGISHCSINAKLPKLEWSRGEFKALCRRAFLMPLSKSIAKKIREVFNTFVKDAEETVERGHVIPLLQDLLKCDLSVDYIDGIAAIWGSANCIDVDAFIAIVSRLAVRHVEDWITLKGMRELTGKDGEKGTITKEKMVEMVPDDDINMTDFSLESAEEMVWMANLDTLAGGKFGDGDRIEHKYLASMLQTAAGKQQKMPPLPVRPQPAEENKLIVTRCSVDTDESYATQQMTDLARDALIDFRTNPGMEELPEYHERQDTYNGPKYVHTVILLDIQNVRKLFKTM
jgi:anti-anti-sigma regulatory factor